MAELPSGTLTFLFTDLEGSTALWERDPEQMREAVARHDQLLAETVAANGGQVVKTTGDGLVAVFAKAADAVAGALACQHALAAESWAVPLTARMGLYTGAAEPVDGDYHAPVLNRAARVMSAGHGGQVVLAESTAVLVADSMVLTDLGMHRLRGLGAPQRLFQVGDGDYGALRSLDALPTNLPSALDSFVGRADEIAHVVDELGAHRLVTLLGVGGVGKTRLALQVAADVLPRFVHGCWVVELATVREPGAVPAAVAAGVGVAQRPGEPPIETVTRHLADRSVLLVLDNCEHMLEAAADAVDQILGGCGGVRVLATSREGLGIRGESVFTVPSLDEAAELFCDRARELDPAFEPPPDQLAVIAQLCDRLDRIPLAVELAAGRARSMTPGEILERVDERFRFLRGGRRRVERHQTLREAIEWSYGLLDPAEQQAFARLGAFAGGFDLAAAEAVVAGAPIEQSDVWDLVDSLVAKSLVQADTTGATTRYRLLETLRQFAAEQLAASTEYQSVQLRHARYFTGVASNADEDFEGAGQQAAIGRLQQVDAELVSALEWLLDRGDIAGAADLVGSSYRYWAVVSLSEGVARVGEAISASASAGLEPGDRATLLAIGSWIAATAGEPERLPWGLEALELVDLHALDFPLQLANLETALAYGGDPDARSDIARRALESARRAGSRWWEVSSMLAANQALNHRGEPFLEPAAEALAAAIDYGAPIFIPIAHRQMALALLATDPEAALSEAEASIATATENAYPPALSFGHATAAVAHAASGRLGPAGEHLSGCIDTLEYTSLANGTFFIGCAASYTFASTAPVEAAQLLGAALEALHYPIDGPYSTVASVVERLRLNFDPAEFERAVARGRSLTIDDVSALTTRLIDEHAGADPSLHRASPAPPATPEV